MVKKEDVRESIHSHAGVTLAHIPSGCHVEVDAAPSRDANRRVAFRLLQSRITRMEELARGTKIF